MNGFVGDQTALAAANWGPGQTPRAVIRAYAQVKLASLTATFETDRTAGKSVWDGETWKKITQALTEIQGGVHDDLFVVPLVQGGAGTSLNMNLNEAVVHLVVRDGGPALHPLNDVNRHQ